MKTSFCLLIFVFMIHCSPRKLPGFAPQITVLPPQKGQDTISLSDIEMNLIDSIFRQALKTHNEKIDTTKISGNFLNPDRYNRQYLLFMDQGQKKVVVNCFCGDTKRFPDWKKEMVLVEDGGNCYINLVIDLTNKQFSEILINGLG